MDRVDVVIPAYNCKTHIQRCVESVLKQDYQNKKIVVVDDFSKDGTASKLKRYPIKVIRNKNNEGLARTINRGIRETNGRYILVLQDDCELKGKDWISNAVKHFKNKKVAGVSGLSYENPKNLSSADKLFRIVDGVWNKPEGVEEVPFVETRCALYDRKKMMGVGDFKQEFFTSGEDQSMCYELRAKGYVFLLDSKLKVEHKYGIHQGSLFKNLGHEFLYGETAVQVFLKYADTILKNVNFGSKTFDPRFKHRMATPLFVSSLVASSLLTALNPAIGIVITLFLLSARIAYYLHMGLKNLRIIGVKNLLPLILVGLAIDFSYTLGCIKGILHQSVKRMSF